MPLSDSLSLTREIDLAPLKRWARGRVEDRPLETLFWIGAALRVWVYLGGRAYWLDEGSLSANLTRGPVFDFSKPLTADQLAPFAFLIVERMMVAAFGASVYVTRLVPLLCGVASIWLFRLLAERLSSRSAAIVAMVLFAFSDDLIYYASELKPYSWDLAIGLVVTLVSLDELRGAPSRGRLALLAATAVVSPWASFPSVFVVAGCGATLVLERLRVRRRRDAGVFAAVAGCWVVSLAFAYRASSRMLVASTSMYVFWNFAFPPFPPTSREALAKTAGILLETFVTPLNLAPPFLPYASAAAAAALLAVGAAALGRRDPWGLALLTAPAALALAASAARRYPFHGRLILWLVPVFFILIAEGARVVRVRAGRTPYIVVLTVVLAYPCWDAVHHAAVGRFREFNIHGDLRKNQFME